MLRILAHSLWLSKTSVWVIPSGPVVSFYRRFILTKMNSENTPQTKPFTVFVEGNVGSGKTTFLKHFAKYEAMILAEPVDNWRNVCGHNLLVS